MSKYSVKNTNTEIKDLSLKIWKTIALCNVKIMQIPFCLEQHWFKKATYTA